MKQMIVFVDSTSSKVLIETTTDDGRRNREVVHAHSPSVSVDDLLDAMEQFRNTGIGDGPWKDVEIVDCCPEDVPIVVDIMTKMWPGKEIYVAQVSKVFSRAVGDLVEKSVSESGVLPF